MRLALIKPPDIERYDKKRLSPALGRIDVNEGKKKIITTNNIRTTIINHLVSFLLYRHSFINQLLFMAWELLWGLHWALEFPP